NYSDFRAYEDSREHNPAPEGTTKEKKNWKDRQTSQSLTYLEQKEFKRLEKDIAQLEEKKSALEKRFTDPELDATTITALSIELNELNNDIEQHTERWFELSLKSDE
ncbi:MAG: ABC transporter C-terminal domain-containing protein, partial [Flavobacteriaceae bacterium]